MAIAAYCQKYMYNISYYMVLKATAPGTYRSRGPVPIYSIGNKKHLYKTHCTLHDRLIARHFMGGMYIIIMSCDPRMVSHGPIFNIIII